MSLLHIHLVASNGSLKTAVNGGMMYYYLFDKYGHFDCRLTAQPVVLPDGWFALQGNVSGGLYMWSDSKTIYTADTPPPSVHHQLDKDGGDWVLPTDAGGLMLRQAKADKIRQLNTAAQSFVCNASGADLVPDFELSTWSLQAAEAQAWAADKSAATPILDGIAAARGMDADKLKAAALRKALAYSALSAHVAGHRQALQSKIEAAKNQAELDKIKIEFTALEAVR